MNELSLFDDQLGGVHRNDPLTSKAAALANFPRSGSQRRRVLRVIYAAGAAGLTAEEAADRTGMPSAASGNSAAKRMSELKQGGWIESSGRTRRTRMGEQAQVMIVSDKLLRKVAEMRRNGA